MVRLAYLTIFWSWMIFLLYWFITARRVKAVSEKQDWAASLAYRIPTYLGIILLWRQNFPEPLSSRLIPHDDLILVSGAAACVAGLGVAIWARRTLAGNWSSNVTFKQGHELVRSGPYRFARHPIYTGLLLMAAGTALAGGQLHSWLGVLFMFIGFWIKLKAEEEVMLRHFPDAYPVYRKEVRAIVPFIL